jgi:putative oxidoreductase
MEAGPRPLVPLLTPIYARLEPLSWLLVRVTTGACLIPHGWQKLLGGKLDGTAQAFAKMGIEPAFALALYIGLLELVGGTLLAIGFLTRLWAVLVIGFMAVAVVHVHWDKGYFWNAGGFEYPLFWGLMALAIAIKGAGRYSVDHLIGHEL